LLIHAIVEFENEDLIGGFFSLPGPLGETLNPEKQKVGPGQVQRLVGNRVKGVIMRDLRELNINDGGEPVTREQPRESQIQAFESRFHVKLPRDYLTLLRFSNGGHPEKNVFIPKGSANDAFWDVSRFYFLNDDKKSFEGLWRATIEWQKAISESIVPIAQDGGGNQILLSFDSDPPNVKLCIHDEELRIVDVANTFGDFIDMLTEDPDMI
jgi:hypothetical protein